MGIISAQQQAASVINPSTIKWNIPASEEAFAWLERAKHMTPAAWQALKKEATSKRQGESAAMHVFRLINWNMRITHPLEFNRGWAKMQLNEKLLLAKEAENKDILQERIDAMAENKGTGTGTGHGFTASGHTIKPKRPV